jgi:integrase
MPTSTGTKRRRGEIETLPSGSLRVKVYAGIDPMTKKRHYLSETIAPGPGAGREAEKARTKLLAQVDERRNPRTRATVNQLLDRWLEVLDVEMSTRRGYRTKIDNHIRPLLGDVPVGRLDRETLESSYAVLRRCRSHCRGRRYTEHRKAGPHECTPVCRPHRCRGLADASIRQIHWIISGALDAAVRWQWISVNQADQARKPAISRPNPRPPSAADAARLVGDAWKDADWGAFVWVSMTTGARRGELCAVHWDDVDLDGGALTLRRALFVDEDGSLKEKDTKTHQHRRIALDPDTVVVLGSLRERCRERAEALGISWSAEGYVFSPDPDGTRPLVPDTASQRFARMAERLGVRCTLHSLRHYSATELISAGVDVHTVAGRLGHRGGGATTLRVYAAWVSEADQRAAVSLSARMPSLPERASSGGSAPADERAGAAD